MPLKVNEIFYSIQGESSFAGYPCVFVRLTGCNLRCSYCDTRYAYEEGDELEVEEIVRRVASFSCLLVEVTGGEPLIQVGTRALIFRLLEDGHRVLLETNGSKDISVVDNRCRKIVDIKCPSSGEEKSNVFENLKRLTQNDEVKFVIADRVDYEYAKKILSEQGGRWVQQIPVHFSPAFGTLAPQDLAAWILEDRLPARLHLQLHKILGLI